MPKSTDFFFPVDHEDETDLLLDWLGYLRGAVLRNIEGVGEAAAHARPDGHLISLAGIVHHLIGVERRWIDGAMLGGPIVRREEEFTPGQDVSVADVITAYRLRGDATDRAVRALPLDAPAKARDGVTLRWVLLHLVNETARHVGHADAVRELTDGSTGE